MSLRVLVTGASGFVGGHLMRVLQASPEVGTVVGWSRSGRGGFTAVDLRDAAATEQAAAAVRPDVVVHLAARAGDRRGLAQDIDQVNVLGSLNLANALRGARLVAVSTGYVYGETPAPATEDSPLSPIGAYATSKVDMERALRQHLDPSQLRLVRPFNHAGPGQSDRYAIPAFARGLLALRAGQRQSLQTGPLGGVRDLGDVRDLARLLVQAAVAPTFPPVCNVCTGEGRSMGAILEELANLLGLTHVAIDSDPQAPSLARNVGSPLKLYATGFRPQHTLTDTLRAVLTDLEAGCAEVRTDPPSPPAPGSSRPAPSPAPGTASD